MSRIVELLDTCRNWRPRFRAAERKRTAEVTASWGEELPTDFAEVINKFGGGELTGETQLAFMDISSLVHDWDTDHHMEQLPGSIVFAHDGGGSFYYFDT